MSKKNRKEAAAVATPSAAPAPVKFWFPAAALIAIAIYEIASALTAHNYPRYAFFVHHGALNALAWSSWALAAALAFIPPLRSFVSGHLERLSTADNRRHLIWVGLAFAGLLAWLGFIRWCQYRSFLLPQDTSNNVNAAYNFIFHGHLYHSIFAISPLSAHFSLQMAIFSPVLLLWNHPFAMILVQTFFVCAAAIALYGLIFVLTRSSMAAVSGFLLAISSPYFYELLTANLHNCSLAAFLPAAMFFAYIGKPIAAAIFFALMAGSVEQVPFIFFGLGIYWILARGWREKRNWGIGLGICAASVAWWVFQMKVIRAYSAAEGTVHIGASFWNLFAHVVPPGTPEAQIPREIIGHPIRTAVTAFSSIYRFYPLLRVLFSFGFLCLLAPAATIPFWLAIGPHILAVAPTPTTFFNYNPINYSDFGLHHPTYMFGPLLWATSHGIKNALGWLEPRGWKNWILVYCLLIAGFGFKAGHRSLHPEWRPSWFEAMPRALRLIPPKARVWADEYASAPVSNRRWLKITQWGPDEPAGYHKLFKPDFVLFDKAFAVHAKPPYRDRMLTFFAKNNYVKAFDDTGVVLLKAPELHPDPEADIPDSEWIKLPEPEAKAVEAYARYLLSQ